MTPTTARAWAGVAGMSADFCGKTGNALFDNERIVRHEDIYIHLDDEVQEH